MFCLGTLGDKLTTERLTKLVLVCRLCLMLACRLLKKKEFVTTEVPELGWSTTHHGPQLIRALCKCSAVPLLPERPPNSPIKQPFSVHCSPSTSSHFLPRPQAFCTARTQMHESPSEDSTGPSSAQGRWGNGRTDRSVNKPVDGLKRFIYFFGFYRRHFSVLRRQLRSSLFKAKGLPVEGVTSQVASYPSK